ncbi:MAG: hypothetical protein M3P49_04315 [Actinomycetota bacterium]|nr:hypothetical protein [Actinomycetota bacterium]
MPRRVLVAVALGGGLRATQIAGEVLGRLPTSGVPEDGSDWIGDALDWFIGRGDVEKGPGGRFRCVPPHLVEGATDGRPRLYGDPLVESRLNEALSSVSASVERKTVYASEDASADRSDAGTRLPVGLERSLSAGVEEARLAEICERSGVAVLRLEQLAAELPRIASVVTPPDADLAHIDLRTGIWEVYDPTAEGTRWRANGYWRSGPARLVRWKASDDLRGIFNARIFYHAGEGRVAEMGWEMASLWQLRLDADAGRPRTCWKAPTQVWVPRLVPGATQRWLEMVSGRPRRRLGRWLVLEMDAAAAKECCYMLAETIGLGGAEGRPPYDGPKRPWRGR